MGVGHDAWGVPSALRPARPSHCTGRCLLRRRQADYGVPAAAIRHCTGPAWHWSGVALVRHGTGPAWHWSGVALVRLWQADYGVPSAAVRTVAKKGQRQKRTKQASNIVRA